MINKIKNNANKISRANMIVWFSLWIFVFVVRQNSVSAEEIIKKPNYSSTSMTDFISQTSLAILSKTIEQAKQQYNSKFNMTSDCSLQRYVSDNNLLGNRKYVPSDLVKISSKNIVNKAERPYLRQPANFALEKMAKAFNTDLDRKFYLISAYRTFHDQATLFEWWCSTIRCAKIWWSEHLLWLAVDIHVATTNGYNKFNWKYLDRMNDNAYKYGFINTYRKGVDIDGKMSEVWHWRYVWVPLATELKKQDLSFAEYYKTTVIAKNEAI